MIETNASALLLGFAERVIKHSILPGSEAEHCASSVDAVPYSHAGVFVTITVNDELRGCIGDMDSSHTLEEAVSLAACGAATRDHRFHPLSAADFDAMEITVTILEPMEAVHDNNDVVVGQHGLFLEYGARRGILLPQVASDRNWNALRFLEAVCEKAGVPRGAWKWPDVTVKRFRATLYKTGS